MPTETYFAAASTALTLLTPASVTATAAKPAVDIANFDRDFMVVLTALNTAGTNPTLAVKLQHAQDVNVIGTVAYVGTGDGTITEVEGGADAVAEDITVTFSNATTAAVVGATSGALGTATVGTKFTSAYVSFLLTAGAADWVNTDAFTIPVSARTYADVTGGGFTTVSGAAATSIQKKSFNCNKLGRYLRAHATIGGTVSPAFATTVVFYGM